MNRSTLSVIIIAGILTLSILGTVSFNTMPVLGDGPELSFGPTSGTAGTPMTFKIKLLDCIATQDGKRCSGISGVSGTMTYDKVAGWGTDRATFGSFTTGDDGAASVTYTFDNPGTYQVYAITNKAATSVEVTITQKTINKIELAGPTTGAAGDILTYAVKVLDCDGVGNCNPVSGENVFLSIKLNKTTDAQKEEVKSATTNAQGIANFTVPFQYATTYDLTAYRLNDNNMVRFPVSNSVTVTIAPSALNSIGPDGSIATPATETSETALALDSLAGAVSSPTGAFWWVLGIGAIILVAILAAVFFLRRREGDEDNEWDADDEN
jgi:hypothetical protein